MWIDKSHCTKPCSVVISRISNLGELTISKAQAISSKESVSVPVLKQKKAQRTSSDKTAKDKPKRQPPRVRDENVSLRTRKALNSSLDMPAPVNKKMSSAQSDTRDSYSSSSSKICEWQKNAPSNPVQLPKIRLKCLKDKQYQLKRKWTLESSKPDELTKVPKDEQSCDARLRDHRKKHRVKRTHSNSRESKAVDTWVPSSNTQVADPTEPDDKTPLSKIVISRKNPHKVHESAFSRSEQAHSSDAEPKLSALRTYRKINAYSVYTKVKENNIESINCLRYRKRKDVPPNNPTPKSREKKHYSFNSYSDSNDSSVEGEVRATLNYILKEVVTVELDGLLSLEAPTNQMRMLLKTFCSQYGYNYDKDFADIKNSVLNFKVTESDSRSLGRVPILEVTEVPTALVPTTVDNDTDSSVPLYSKAYKHRRKRKHVNRVASSDDEVDDEEDDEMLSAMMRSRSKERRNRLSREVLYTRTSARNAEVPQRKYTVLTNRRLITSEDSSEGYQDAPRSERKTRFSVPKSHKSELDEDTDCGDTGLTCNFFPTLTSEDSSEEEEPNAQEQNKQCPGLIHISSLAPKDAASVLSNSTPEKGFNHFFPELTSEESSDARDDLKVTFASKTIEQSYAKSDSHADMRSYLPEDDKNYSPFDLKQSFGNIKDSSLDVQRANDKKSDTGLKNLQATIMDSFFSVDDNLAVVRKSDTIVNSSQIGFNYPLSIENYHGDNKQANSSSKHSRSDLRADTQKSSLDCSKLQEDVNIFLSDSKNSHSGINNSSVNCGVSMPNLNSFLCAIETGSTVDSEKTGTVIEEIRSPPCSLFSKTTNSTRKMALSPIQSAATADSDSDSDNLIICLDPQPPVTNSPEKEKPENRQEPEKQDPENQKPEHRKPENWDFEKGDLKNQKPENRKSEIQKSEIQKSENQKPEIQDPQNWKFENRDLVNHQPNNRKLENQEPENQKPKNQKLENRKLVNQEPQNWKVESKDLVNHQPKNRKPKNRKLENSKSEKKSSSVPRDLPPPPLAGKGMTRSSSLNQLRICPPEVPSEVVLETITLLEDLSRFKQKNTEPEDMHSKYASPCSKSVNGLCVGHQTGKPHRTPVQKVLPLLMSSVPLGTDPRTVPYPNELSERIQTTYVPIQPKPPPPPLRFSPDTLEPTTSIEQKNAKNPIPMTNLTENSTQSPPPLSFPSSPNKDHLISTSDIISIEKPLPLPVLPSNCLPVPPLTTLSTTLFPAFTFTGSTPVIQTMPAPPLTIAITSAITPTGLIVSPLTTFANQEMNATPIGSIPSDVDISILRTLLLDPVPDGGPSAELHNLIMQQMKNQEEAEQASDTDFTLPVISNVVSLRQSTSPSEIKKDNEKSRNSADIPVKTDNQVSQQRSVDISEIVAEKIKSPSPPAANKSPPISPKNNLLLGGGITDVVRNLQLEIANLEKLADEKRKEYHLITYIRNYKRDTLKKLQEGLSSITTASVPKSNRTQPDSGQVHLKETCLVRPMVKTQQGSLEAIKTAQESLALKPAKMKTKPAVFPPPRGLTVAKLIVESQSKPVLPKEQPRQQPIQILTDQTVKMDSESKKGFRPYLNPTTTTSTNKEVVPSESGAIKPQSNFPQRLPTVQASSLPTLVPGSAPTTVPPSWISKMAATPTIKSHLAPTSSVNQKQKQNLANWKGTVSAFLQAEAKCRTPSSGSPNEAILNSFANPLKNPYNPASPPGNAVIGPIPNSVKNFSMTAENAPRISSSHDPKRLPVNSDNAAAPRLPANTESPNTLRLHGNNEHPTSLRVNSDPLRLPVPVNTENVNPLHIPVSASNSSGVAPSFMNFYPFSGLPGNYFQTHPLWPQSLGTMNPSWSSLQAARELYLNHWTMNDWKATGRENENLVGKQVPPDPSRRAPPANPSRSDRASTGSRPVLYGPLRKCVVCKKSDAQFICSGCGRDWYCSVNCQRQNWKVHSGSCVASST